MRIFSDEPKLSLLQSGFFVQLALTGYNGYQRLSAALILFVVFPLGNKYTRDLCNKQILFLSFAVAVIRAHTTENPADSFQTDSAAEFLLSSRIKTPTIVLSRFNTRVCPSLFSSSTGMPNIQARLHLFGKSTPL